MNRTRSLIGIRSVCVLALVPLLAAPQSAGAKAQAAKITGKTLLPVSEVKWTPLPGIDGAEQAQLWGDPTKETHRAFYKYPIGLKSPVHTHTYGDRGVIVSGTLSLAVEGDEPCVFYIEREGPFDVVLVDEASSKKQ